MRRQGVPIQHLFPAEQALEADVIRLADEGSISFGDAALDSMVEQDVSDLEVVRMLRRGIVLRERRQGGDIAGECLCRIIDIAGKGRDRTIVANIKCGRILVLTVNWDESK